MCGIYFVLAPHGTTTSQELLHEPLSSLLHNRGPDSFNTLLLDNLFFAGYVLWQQGETLCDQPIDIDDIVLLFNGDVFNITHKKPNQYSDSFFLANKLASCYESDGDIIDVFAKLNGPYSLVLYCRSSHALYFARDPMGRNSLLIERDGPLLKLCSTSYYDEGSKSKITMELPPLGVFKINLDTPDYLWLMPWKSQLTTNADLELTILKQTIKFETLNCINEIRPKWISRMEPVSKEYDFYKMVTELKISGLQSLQPNEIYDALLRSPILQSYINKFDELLNHSVNQRVSLTAQHCRNCITKRLDCKHAKVALLYSGGIDCSILALIMDRYVRKCDAIELINVAFERSNAAEDKWDVPDRLTAKKSLSELQRLCPDRTWNFIEVNVTREELSEMLTNHIKHLIYPLNTVLDESLGAAFWFAARGHSDCGQLSSARIAILGSGADELFGGYTRHRNAYKRCKGTSEEKEMMVARELNGDWDRLPSRNLARDDRVIADTGKTARAPYLEERIVGYVHSLQPNQRCCFELDEGIGDKLFLRLYGHSLGLKICAKLKKRAVQFGSRIANKNQNAKDISEYLKYK